MMKNVEKEIRLHLEKYKFKDRELDKLVLFVVYVEIYFLLKREPDLI